MEPTTPRARPSADVPASPAPVAETPLARRSRAIKTATMELVVVDDRGVLTVEELIEFASQLKAAKVPGTTEVRPQHDSADDRDLLVVKFDPASIPSKRWGWGR